jgi:hypothetical protein
VTTAVAVALLAAGGADAATKHSLDGRRTTTAHYKGDLDSPVIPTEAATQPDPTTPALADCTPGACDIRELHLMLPRGSSAGRFHATVVVDSSLEATLVLYNAEGEVLQRHDWYNSVPNEDDDGSLKYQLDVHVERLSRGLYTLALIDQAGIGSYDATLAWVAHPRPRG